jgi:hypothetical protein
MKENDMKLEDLNDGLRLFEIKEYEENLKEWDKKARMMRRKKKIIRKFIPKRRKKIKPLNVSIYKNENETKQIFSMNNQRTVKTTSSSTSDDDLDSDQDFIYVEEEKDWDQEEFIKPKPV